MEDKIGIFLCECGPNIAEKVDFDKVKEAIKNLKSVKFIGQHKLLCSDDGKKYIVNAIKEHGLTRLVIAACSPKQHELTFMKVCEEAGLNPYLFQMANIREHCAWIIEDKKEATEKAIQYIKSAYRRVRYHEPLEKKEIEANPDVLVIGGGITGLEVSLALAQSNRKVYIVEKSSELGGKLKEFNKIFTSMRDAKSFVEDKIKLVEQEKQIEVLKESEVEEVLGYFGNFIVKVKTQSKESELKVGAIVVATGYELFDGDSLAHYGYGIDDVYTALEFERMVKTGKILTKKGEPPKSVAIIHCVGRKECGYCSGVCCMYSIKFARYIKEKMKDAEVIEFHRGLTLPDKNYEKFYKDTKALGVNYIYVKDLLIEGNTKPIIKYKTEEGQFEKQVDMVVLAQAMVPPKGIDKLAKTLRIAQDKSGFFIEEHPKLAPISTSKEGVFIAGCAQGPKNIKESIVQAGAVAGRILSSLVPGKKLEPEVRVSQISESLCIGCQTCIKVCNYGAIYFDEAKRVSRVNEVLCRGCGNCVASCPSSAIQLKHFTDREIHEEIVEATR